MKKWVYLILGLVLVINLVVAIILVFGSSNHVDAVVRAVWSGLFGLFGIAFLRKARRLFKEKEG